jgi:integrase
MRQGELLSLSRENIKGNVAYLPITKNGKPRSVPLSSRALAVINGLPVPLHGGSLDFPGWDGGFGEVGQAAACICS